MNYQSHLPQWHCAGKRILVRTDFNIPTKNGVIIDDFKLTAALPTIDYILNHGGSIIVLTHIGRPTQPTADLSTQILMPWFEQRNYQISFARTIQELRAARSPIVLFENLRFFSGEQHNDAAFAAALAACGDAYVNDAFGVLHRTDTSVTLLPLQFLPANKTMGFLVATELNTLNALTQNPAHPFTVIMGGNKPATKIPALLHLLDTATTVLLCPALVFTFLHAQKKPVGLSLVDPTVTDLCLQIIQKAHEKKVTLIFPSDYVVAHNSIDGTLHTTATPAIDASSLGISIGPKTVAEFIQKINESHTIFFNGTFGFIERKETGKNMEQILRALAHAKGKRIIAGGDSVATVRAYGLTDDMSYLSTGGGAALHVIAHQKLPALEALK